MRDTVLTGKPNLKKRNLTKNISLTCLQLTFLYLQVHVLSCYFLIVKAKFLFYNINR